MILQYINCVTYEQFVRKLGKPLFGLVFCYSAASGRSSEPGPQILELVRYSHIGNRVLFVTLRGVLTPDSSGEKERSRPWCRQQLLCCLSLPRWEQFAGKLGDGHWDCDLCLERISHHFFVVARSETQSCGAEFSLGASDYLVPSA